MNYYENKTKLIKKLNLKKINLQANITYYSKFENITNVLVFIYLPIFLINNKFWRQTLKLILQYFKKTYKNNNITKFYKNIFPKF